MRILVIGAGWYGCHLASVLIQKGIDVDIVDKANDFFQGSSSKNQNRLHLGYHYPRSDDTITECKEGYTQFCEIYGDLIVKFTKNLYFIESSGASNVTMNDYIAKLQQHSLPIKPYDAELPLPIYHMETPILEVEEQYIDPFKSRDFFKDHLGRVFLPISSPDTFSSMNNIVKECIEAVKWSKDTGRNELGTVLAVLRALKKHEKLNL